MVDRGGSHGKIPRIKEEFRCEACGTAFWVVRTEKEASGRLR
jgi:hypothetical protein